MDRSPESTAGLCPVGEPEPCVSAWPEDAEDVGIGPWPDMPEKVYRKHPAVSHSDIRHWLKPRNLGRAGVVGSATHTLAMEGRAALEARYVTAGENFDLRTREGKEKAAELVGDSGKELLRFKERALVERMFAALAADPMGRKVLDAPGQNELSLVGLFEGFGQTYKARIDMERRLSNWDLKTTSYVNEEEWLQAEVAYGYINQAEWYSSLYAALTGERRQFWFLCVSKREPHNVWTRRVPDELLAHSRKWREDILTLYERYVPKEMRHGTKRIRRGAGEGPGSSAG